MTAQEKKVFAFGAGAGILAVLIVLAVLFVRERRFLASETPAALPQPAASSRPVAAMKEDAGTQPGATVELSPAEISAAGVQVAEVKTAVVRTGIEAFGRVEQPEAQLAAVSARIGGRVDKLLVQYTGERVQRGQAVAELYSPEVATAVEEYRLAQENRARLSQSGDQEARNQAEALVAASRRKLELWGVTGKQIEERSSDTLPHVTLYAYASGTVIDRKVTQGQYVNAGDTLFTIADLSNVWIKADVYEDQLPQIRQGQPVEIAAEALPGHTLHGRVDFIEPQANQQTRTVPVHVHVANPGMRLVPGMFVTATFSNSAARPSIVVPRSAVLDTGNRKIVYIAKPNGVFEAREVRTGAPSEDLFPVTAGLALGDKVVLNGNFLIDSQAHLSSGMSGLYGGSKEFNAAAAGAPAQPAAPAAGKPAEASAAKLDLHFAPIPFKAAQDTEFRATLVDANGKPIEDAHVTVTLVMPAMPSMGMPEMRSSFDLAWNAAAHTYSGKGQAPMAGPWTVTVEALRNGATIATLRTRVNAN